MELKNTVIERLGFLRSYIIYLCNPLKRKRLRTVYASFLQAGDLCFDIGAHVGIHSRIWLDMGMRVVAVEPNPRLAQYLQRSLGHHHNFHLRTEAISDSRGMTAMHISSLAPTVSTLASNEWRQVLNDHSSFDVKWDKEIEVQTLCLDDLIEQYGDPAFIKLDIENHENEALSGLHHSIPHLSFEYFSYLKTDSINCLEQIEKNGVYEYNYSVGEEFAWQWSEWRNHQQMCSWVQNRALDSPNGDIFARLANR